MFDWHLTKDIYFLNLQSGLNKGDDIVVRERKLLIQVEDLREKMRQQQNNQAVEKQELVPSFFLFTCLVRVPAVAGSHQTTHQIGNRGRPRYCPQLSVLTCLARFFKNV